jgi:hypothetical protein
MISRSLRTAPGMHLEIGNPALPLPARRILQKKSDRFFLFTANPPVSPLTLVITVRRLSMQTGVGVNARTKCGH